MIKNAFLTSFMIFLAVVAGGGFGSVIAQASALSDYVDYLILALVFLVFVDVPLEKPLQTLKHPKVLLIAWITNFCILPFLGWGLSHYLLSSQPLVAIGLAVYFMSPCTDWFLGFTRMAKGNTGLGSILLPINMLTQLLLYPFLMHWFSESTFDSVSASEITSTLIDWFFIPVTAAIGIKVITWKQPQIREMLSGMTNWIVYALVFVIFAANIDTIVQNYEVFGGVLLTVMAFFAVSLALTEWVAAKLQFSHENHVLYTMTTSARNAPLMLGLTMTALPDQPIVYAAIIIGMLIEFPYLAMQVMRFNLRTYIVRSKIL